MYEAEGFNLDNIYIGKEGKTSHVTSLWAPPGGGEQPEPAKTVLFHRKLLYSAVLMFLINYCKNMSYVRNVC